MSILAKWKNAKNALVNQLNAFRIKDRHSKKRGAPPGGFTAKRIYRINGYKIFSRRSVILAGVYTRSSGSASIPGGFYGWGKIPFPEIPGVKREMGVCLPVEVKQGRIQLESEGEIPAPNQAVEKRGEKR